MRRAQSTGCTHTCCNCGCASAIADVCIWIATEKEQSECIPADCKSTADNHWISSIESYFSCNVYVHQAKIRPSATQNQSGRINAMVVAGILQLQCSTTVCNDTLAPIWNQVLPFSGLRVAGSPQSCLVNSPLIALDLFDIDSKKVSSIFKLFEIQYIGQCEIPWV